MSQSSQTPPGNRPPNPKVVRPFTGGPTGQGESKSPSSPPPMGRRPIAGRPYRPFAGQPMPAQAEAPTPPAEAPTMPAVDLTVEAPAAAPAPRTPSPAYQTPVISSTDRTAWEAYISGPSSSERHTEPVIQHRDQEPRQPMTEEPQIEVQEPTPVYSTAMHEQGGYDPTAATETREAEAESEEQEITAEVPAYEPYVVTPPEPSPVISVGRHAPPPRAVYQTPMFVPPTGETPAESLIDDVDAAFIAAGLPSGPEYSASEEALRAAASLEAIARKLRTGKIELRSASESSLASDEAILAAVLAALLATR